MSKLNQLIKVSLATAFFVSPLLAQEIDNQEERLIEESVKT